MAEEAVSETSKATSALRLHSRFLETCPPHPLYLPHSLYQRVRRHQTAPEVSEDPPCLQTAKKLSLLPEGPMRAECAVGCLQLLPPSSPPG